MKNIIDIIPFPKFPFKFKLFVAKILIRCLRVDKLPNDIILFNELTVWIETEGRPTTSNVNYHINKD